MDAVEVLLNHIEEIKVITDATYISMLENLQVLHENQGRTHSVERIVISIEQMHLCDEYMYNLIRNIVGRRTMNAGHLCQILRRKGYSPEMMGYDTFKQWMEDLHIHIVDNNIVFP